MANLASRTGRMLLLVGLGLLAAAPIHAQDNAPAVPDFRLKNLDGKSISLHESLATGPVLVSFWATWCKPCLQEMPHLNDIHAEFSEQGLQVFLITIDLPRNHNRVRSYVRSHDYDFEVLLDPNKDAFRKLHGQSVPYVVLLRQDGKPAYVKLGYRAGDEKDLAKAIEELLAADTLSDEPVPAPKAKAGGTN